MPDVITMIERIRGVLWVAIAVLAVQIVLLFHQLTTATQVPRAKPIDRTNDLWHSPSVSEIPQNAAGELIRYGRELIEHTAVYLGPKGSVAAVSNGLNCQNCHLDAGTRPFAANYGAVASMYPKLRHRSGTVEGFEKRVNDCIERSLNGKGLPADSREMKAIIAYLNWVGKDVQRGVTPRGTGLVDLALLDRPADPVRGREHYSRLCTSCHGVDGTGEKAENGIEWKYPPLWGTDSYNTGAGLYRISRFAAFIKANMPYGTRYDNPVLSDEEAWDIAAYVNSMPRPHKNFPHDWPDVSRKPMDHPFGPYADVYPEQMHKYGPFGAIEADRIRRSRNQ